MSYVDNIVRQDIVRYKRILECDYQVSGALRQFLPCNFDYCKVIPMMYGSEPMMLNYFDYKKHISVDVTVLQMYKVDFDGANIGVYMFDIPSFDDASSTIKYVEDIRKNMNHSDFTHDNVIYIISSNSVILDVYTDATGYIDLICDKLINKYLEKRVLVEV